MSTLYAFRGEIVNYDPMYVGYDQTQKTNHNHETVLNTPLLSKLTEATNTQVQKYSHTPVKIEKEHPFYSVAGIRQMAGRIRKAMLGESEQEAAEREGSYVGYILAIQKDPKKYTQAPIELQHDPRFAIIVMKNNVDGYQYMPEEIRANHDVVRAGLSYKFNLPASLAHVAGKKPFEIDCKELVTLMNMPQTILNYLKGAPNFLRKAPLAITNHWDLMLELAAINPLVLAYTEGEFPGLLLEKVSEANSLPLFHLLGGGDARQANEMELAQIAKKMKQVSCVSC